MIVDELQINTGQAVKSVKDLRKELKDLKDQMLTAAQGSEQYNKALVKAANIQKQLKDQMQEVNNSAMDFGQYMGNAGKAMAGVTGAVTAATAAMNLFGVENEEAAQAVTATMTSLIGLTQGLSAIDNGVKAFRALTIAINASVAGMNALKLAIAATGIGALVVLIATLVVKWNDWFGATKKENEALERAKYLIKDLNDDIKEEERLIRIRVGTARNEGKSESELIKIREQGIQKILENIQAAKQKIAQDAQTITSMKKLKVLQEDLNKLLEQETFYRDQLADAHIDEGLAIQKEKKDEAEASVKAADDARTAAANLAKFELEMAKTKLDSTEQYSQKAFDLQMNYYDRLFNIYGKDSEEYKNTILEKTQYIKDFNDHYKEIITDFQNSRKTEQELLDERYKILIEAAKKSGQDTQDIELWYKEETLKKEKELLDNFNKEQKATSLDLLQQQLDERYQLLIAAAEKTGQDTTQIEQWYLQESQRIIDQASESNLNLLKKWDEEQMNEFDLERQRLDERYIILIDAALKEGRDTTDIFKWYQEEQTKIADKEAKKQKEINKAKVKGYASMANTVGDILGSLSDLMEEGTAAQKGIAVAATAIQMFAGIATAIATAQKLGPPQGPIVGALNAAAVGAAGIASIAKILAVKEDGSNAGAEAGGGGSYVASIAIPSVVEGSNDFVQSVDGAMTENAIQDTKVVVLESDITETQKKVEVTESLATF